MVRPWIVGGPCYQRRLSAEHSVSVAAFAHGCGARGQALAWGYLHAVPPEVARNELFARALASDASALVWLDADCYLVNPAEVYRVAASVVGQESPLVGGVVLLGDREHISIADEGTGWRLAPFAPTGPERVYAMGLGMAVFDLDRYRAEWPTGPWFQCGYHGELFESEDHWHTSHLSERLGTQALAWHEPLAEHLP